MRRKCIAVFLCLSLIFGQYFPVSAAPKAEIEAEKIKQSDLLEANTQELQYKKDEVIIVYKNEMADMKAIDQALKTNRVKRLDETERVLADLRITEQEEIDVSDVISGGTAAVAKLPDGVSVQEAVKKLEHTEKVAYVQKNYLYRLQSTKVNDSKKSGAYYLNNLNLEKAWSFARADGSSYNKTGKPVTVAVLDTGINYDPSERHEDMKEVGSGGNIWYSYAYDACQQKKMSEKGTDWFDPTGPFTDYVGHGTRVASLIAARANNNKGMAGTSYNGRVLPINIFDEPFWTEEKYMGDSNLYGYEAFAPTSAILAAYQYVLKYADRLNIKVVNMSFESTQPDQAVEDCIAQAYQKGILSVAAAGNYDSFYENGKTKVYPASYKHVLSVAAVGMDNMHSDFSRYNKYVDISAPGELILMPAAGYAHHVENGRVYWYKKNGYTNQDCMVNGTSFSSPIVAGIAALLYAADPNMTPTKATQCLILTATDRGQKGKDNYYGYGVVDAYKAVQKALGKSVKSNVSATMSLKNMTAKPTRARVISSASLSATKLVYNGKTRKPSVTVRYSDRIIAENIVSNVKNVALKYSSGPKKVGTYQVEVNGRNVFNGTIIKTYRIIPRSVNILSSVGTKHGFRIRWKQRTVQVDGYQIGYSTKADMAGADVVTIRKNTTDAKTIDGLKAKKYYYTRVRTYKKTGGKTYFSNWSDVVKIKTK